MARQRNKRLLTDAGLRLRSARETEGLTQEALAERMDIHPAAVSRAERGLGGMSLTTWKAAADALGLPLGDLLDGGDPPVPDPERAEILRLWSGSDPDRRRLLLRMLEAAVREE